MTVNSWKLIWIILSPASKSLKISFDNSHDCLLTRTGDMHILTKKDNLPEKTPAVIYPTVGALCTDW